MYFQTGNRAPTPGIKASDFGALARRWWKQTRNHAERNAARCGAVRSTPGSVDGCCSSRWPRRCAERRPMLRLCCRAGSLVRGKAQSLAGPRAVAGARSSKDIARWTAAATTPCPYLNNSLVARAGQTVHAAIGVNAVGAGPASEAWALALAWWWVVGPPSRHQSSPPNRVRLCCRRRPPALPPGAMPAAGRLSPWQPLLPPRPRPSLCPAPRTTVAQAPA